MVREKAKIDLTQPQTKSSSLRETKRSELEDLTVAANSTLVLPSTTRGPQKLCAQCHFSCLRCRGPNDYDCTDCAPDSSLKILINNQGTCEDLPVDKAAQAADLLFVRLTSDEIILIAVCLSAITFIMALGAYFFFRNICCDRTKANGNSYLYNALDDEEKLRLTYSQDSAVAFKREVDSIINDESSSLSCSDDEDDYENVKHAEADDYRRFGGSRREELVGLEDDEDDDEDVFNARPRTRNF